MRKCIICGGELNGKPILRLNNVPAYAQDLPGKEDLQNDFGIELDLHQCSYCGLIQFDCDPVPYYRDVIRGGGFSETIQTLRRQQYTHLIKKYQLEGKKVIEIGCGEGEFLLPLRNFPVKTYGIEHRDELVQKARSRGLNVWKSFPEDSKAIIDNGPFDAFVMFQFLEHQPKPNDMLRCIYNNLSEDGIGLVTVPSFQYVLGKNAFYEFMRDHLAYYTEDSLRFLIEHNGFQIAEMETINCNTISAIVRKRKRTNLTGFVDNIEVLTKRLTIFAEEKRTEGKKIALWGASHEAFMILSITGFGKNVEYIIDSAVFKQGKYAPASHVPIVSPEHWFDNPVESIMIIAPEYASEISKVAKERYGETIQIYSLYGSDILSV